MLDIAQLHLLRPAWLWALLPLLLLVVGLLYLRLQNNFWQKKVDAELLPHLLSGENGKQSRGGLLLLFVGWLLAVLALAGLSWEKLPAPTSRGQSGIVIVMDLSRSMDVKDVSPSRLEWAKQNLLSYLNASAGESIGLVLFAQQAYLATPLSEDYSSIIDVIKNLQTDVVPIQGSRPELGVDLAVSMLRQWSGSSLTNSSGQILLLTDGSHQPGALLESVAQAKNLDIVTSVVAVGSTNGGLVPLTANSDQFVKSGGRAVTATVDLSLLRSVAQVGRGDLFHNQAFVAHSQSSRFAGSADPELTKSDPGSKLERWQESGFVLLYALIPLAAMAFRRGWLGSVVLCFLLTGAAFFPLRSVQAAEWQELWIKKDLVAYELYHQHRIAEAAALFQDRHWKATSLYRIGDFQQAADIYQQDHTARGYFNLGNALAQQAKVDEAIEAYYQALELDVDFDDARHNLSLLEKYQQQKKGKTQKKPPGFNKPKPKKDTGVIAQGENKGKKKGASEDKKKVLEESDKKPRRKQPNKKEKSQGKDKGKKPSEEKVSPKQTPKINEASKLGPVFGARLASKKDSSIGPAQWLNMIEDKPNELLRLKYKFLHQQNPHPEAEGEKPW